MGAKVGDPKERGYFGTGAIPGETIADRYRVVRELGAGGMGQVVVAEHLELEKNFALKLIRPDRWDASLEARFRREARALARVSSPRVAQVTDFGVDDQRGPFYVMELVEGEALHELIRREGPLPRDRALEIAVGIARALEDVHEAGIVHRDIKPGNIGVCAKGPVPIRLLDFGLATSVDERFGSRITESKRVVGSMPYMAPEQFHGEAPSPAVDLWALGIVMYEMLSGRLPFEAPTTAALIQKILNESPAPLPFEQKAGLLARFLAKDAALRPRSATEARELIEDAIENPDTAEANIATAEATRIVPTGGGREGPSRRAPRLAIGLGLLGLVAASIALGVWLSRQSAAPVRAVDLAPEPPVAPGGTIAPAIEPTPAEPTVPPSPTAPESDPAAPAPEVTHRAEPDLAPPEPPARGVPAPARRRERGRGATSPRRRRPSTSSSSPADDTPEDRPWDGTIIESPSP